RWLWHYAYANFRYYRPARRHVGRTHYVLVRFRGHSTVTQDLLRPSRHAMISSSARTASWTGTTGRASNTNAGSIEQNLWTVSGSSHSTNIWPPHSPTRTA